MNLPEQFTKEMRKLLGEEYEAYLQSYDNQRVQGLRINTQKISVSDFLKITPFHLTPIPWTENGFYYSSEETVTKHPHYYAGLYYVQEPSAMIPASRLPIEEGDLVLDLCAAPGGKATELGARLKNCGLLVANDISNSRAKGLLKNLELFGIGNMLVTSEEPEKLLRYFNGFFDKILIDAPCSGEGMFRKDPAMIKSWMEHGPDYYAALQEQITKTAMKLLRPGGMLLYSTCTFSTLENEGTIEKLLREDPSLTLVPMKGYEAFTEGSLPYTVRVWPHRLKGEGHFAALLKKETDHKEDRPFYSPQKAGKLPKELLEFLEGIPRLKKQQTQIEIRDGRAYLLPHNLPPIRGLRFLRTGLYLGDCKKNRFEPSQAFAMYLKLDDYPNTISFAAKDERVLRYLKGESIELQQGECSGYKGWVLAGVDGYPLGWAKMANGTLKNKYYPGWRMQ